MIIIVDIYIITNTINGKEYVGITTKGYLNRFKSHIKSSYNKNDKRGRYVLYRAMRKHGVENFKVELLEQVDTYKEAKFKEKEYVTKFKTYYRDPLNWGYNMTKGGDGTGTFIMSENQKNKLSQITKNLHKTPEYREKFLRAMRSDSHRISVSIANSGERNGMYKKGYLISGDKNYWFGKKGVLSANYGNKYSDGVKDKIRQNTLYHWNNNKAFRDKNLNHIKKLGEKQRGINNPTAKKTYLYNECKKFLGEYCMKDIYDIVGCSPQTARRHKDTGVLYKGYYIYSNKLEE